MNSKRWSQSRSTLFLVTVLLALVGGGVFVWMMDTQATLASPSVASGTKSVSAAEVPPGSYAQYTLVIEKTGGTANVIVSDVLDGDLSFDDTSVSVEPTGTGSGFVSSGQTVTFTLYSVSAGSVITINFDARLATTATTGDIISNTATISSADMAVPVNTNVAAFTVGAPPAIQIYTPDNGEVIVAQEGSVQEVTGRVWSSDLAVFPDVPTLNAVSCLGSDCTVSWSAVPEAEQYVIQEATVDTFDNATEISVAATPTYKTYTGKSPGTYYYRVASLLIYGSPPQPHRSRWSDIRSVTLTAVGEAIENAVPSLMGLDADPLDITVEVSTDDGAHWHAASDTLHASGDWWDWTYDWTLPVGDDVLQAIMARVQYADGGEYGMDTITVTLRNSVTRLYMPVMFKRWPPVPYEPQLSATNPGTGNDYTVSWTYSHSDIVPTEYQLEEATNSAFTENVSDLSLNAATLSKAYTDKPDGTYYYRVRGRNSWGYGPWSNVVTVSVSTGRTYGFDSSTMGWEVTRSDELGDLGQIPDPVAMNGSLYHMIIGKGDYSILSPMEPGPAVPYRIRARTDIIESATIGGSGFGLLNGMTYGIIFGGNAGSPCPVGRADYTTGCLSHYYRLLVTYDMEASQLAWQLKRISSHDEDNAGQGDPLINWGAVPVSHSGVDWNTWEIRVTDASSGNIKIYFNDSHIGSTTDKTYINDRYFGTFMASTKELGGVATRWDYFIVETLP